MAYIPPAGATTQVQFNNAGVMGADSAFTWDNVNKIIHLSGQFPFVFDWRGDDLSFTMKGPSSVGADARAGVNYFYPFRWNAGVACKPNTSQSTSSLACLGNYADLTSTYTMSSACLWLVGYYYNTSLGGPVTRIVQIENKLVNGTGTASEAGQPELWFEFSHQEDGGSYPVLALARDRTYSSGSGQCAIIKTHDQANSVIRFQSVPGASAGVFATVAEILPSGVAFAKSVSHGETALTLANGANQNIAVTSSFVHVTGPTGAFSVGGVAGPRSGEIVTFWNEGTGTMTVKHNDAGSSAGNRIVTNAQTDVACGGTYQAWFTVQYSAAAGFWILLGHS